MTIQFEIVRAAALRLLVFPYPPYPGSEAISLDTLYPIENTGVWQRASVVLSLVVTNGDTIDVTQLSEATVTANTPMGMVPNISDRFVLSVQGPGVVILDGTFGSASNFSVLTVSSTPVRVANMTINPLVSNTLSGIAGRSNVQLTVNIIFNDSTQYLNFPTNPSLPSLPTLLTFNASDSSISVSESGLLQPLANSISLVTVQSNAGSVTTTTSFMVNLDPDIGDIDLEFTASSPRVMETISVQVFVNTGASSLGSVDVIVTYDPRVLQVLEVRPGLDWVGGVQEASLNDPLGEIQFGGALTVGGVTGPRLHIFTLLFQVLSATSESYLRGTVVTLAERNIGGTPIGPPTPRPIVAGNITFSTSAAVGKRSTQDVTPPSIKSSVLRWRRATDKCLLPPCPCSGMTAGDVDGNCAFDVHDVAYTLIYITESLLNFTRPQGQEILNRTGAAQQQQLDPNQDGTVDISDAYFLLRAVFRLVHFLQRVEVTPVQSVNSTCLFLVQVQLASEGGDAQETLAQTEVFVDISFTTTDLQAGFDSSSLSPISGSLATGNKGPGLAGGVIRARRMESNVFLVQLNASFVSEDIGISVILATFDAFNTTDVSRTAHFFGPPPAIYTSSLSITIPVRNSMVFVVATAGYSPLIRVSNTLQSQDCSEVPLIGQQLTVIFMSPFQADLEWELLNMRMGLDFTSLIQLLVTNCSVSQNGSTVDGSCVQDTVIGTHTNTSHTLPTLPFTDYQFQVRGPDTESDRVQIRSPETNPEGLSPPTITTNPTSTTFTWSPPTHPNGIITHYTLHIGATVFFNGSALSLTISNDQLQLGAIYIVFLEARNSAGSTRSANVTLELVPPVGTEGPPLVGQLTIGALLGLVVAGALLVVIVLLMLLAAAMWYQRRSRKKKGPTILSNDFEFENMGVEKIPLPGDSVDVLLPLTVQKGKHFAEKFSTEDSTTFWYQDEKGIEFLPPYASSAEESSEGEYPPESGYEDQWELGDLPPLGELDMSDLWVTDDTIPLTETKRRSRKFSLSKQRRHSATKDQQPQRHSSLLHRLSFSRRREEDRLRLVEEEEEPVGEPDVLSEKEMENFKAQITSLDRSQQRRESQAERERKVSAPVRGPPLREEVHMATEQPEPSSETAIEVANRLRDTVRSGEYRTEYNRLMSVQPSVPPDQASLPCNAPKNRYRNVLPPDHTRVKLLDADPQVEGSDYINASFLNGHCKKRAYIASQGPLPNTIVDFWRMVWQQRSRAIVMTTNTIEKNTKKCEKYWPDQGSTQSYGPVTVSCTHQKKHKDYTESKLLVTMEGTTEQRHLTHYHYTAWGDFRTPPVAGFLEMVEKVGETVKGRPIVVHCSAGLGRTGVFVTVHRALECHRAKHQVAMETTVKDLRLQRGGMIQTLDQYRFCLESVAEALAPEKLPRRESEPAQRPRTKETGRPFSEPPLEDTPKTRRKLYLQHAIPPPPSYPPPDSDSEHKEAPTTSPIGSPPPLTSPPPPITSPPSPPSGPPPPITSPPPVPSSPPPPPSSPPPPPSSPPPPFTSPPPPFTPEPTPIKLPATPPEVIITPPTRRPSEESDSSLLERKLAELSDQRTETARETGVSKTETAKKSSGKGERGRKSSFEKKTQPERKTEPQKRKSSGPKPVPEPKDDDLTEKFPIPSKEEEEEVEEEPIGFEIGDDQVLISTPYKKPERKVDKKPPPRWQPWQQQQSKGPTAPKKKIPPPKVPPPKVPPPKVPPPKVPPPKVTPPKVTPPVVHRDTDKDKSPPRRVGKLVIPAAFGGGGEKLEDKISTPPPDTKKQVSPQVENNTNKPPPSHVPPLSSEHREQVATSGRIGKVDTSKWQTPSESPSLTPTFLRKSKESAQRDTPTGTQESGSQTPPILRKIRQIEKGSLSPSSSPTQQTSVTATEQVKLEKPPKVPEKSHTAPPQETDTAPSGNVARLLARFQGGQ